MKLFGPSIMDLVKDKRRADMEAPLPDADFDPGTGTEWQLELKKKRRSLLMKKMLADAGYNDLAKMVSIKEH